MEFRILGPLEVADDAGRTVPLGGARQRALLAALLLHANEVVPLDRLIDELWGESPPTSGSKALQVAVSQLRKTLGDGLLQTRPAGYLLRLEPDQLDLTRFETLRERAHAALDSGHPAEAASALREALGLWRGPALADVAYELFARAEAERLEELRLGALEERIEADLALGRDAELVAELDALVAKHPLRERLREHLMLALYRSGRQAEALEVYRETRRMLAEELGIDPDERLQHLERAILRHDPDLQGVAPSRDPRPGRLPARPRGALVAAGAAAVVAVVGVGLFLLLHGSSTLASASPDSVAVIDPGRNALVGEVAVGGSPGPIDAGGNAVWVLNRNSRTLSKIDVRTRRVTTTFGVGANRPDKLAVVEGGVIVADFPASRLTFFVRGQPWVASAVLLDVPGGPGLAIGDLAEGAGDIWAVAAFTSELIRIHWTAVDASVERIALDRPGVALAPEGNEFMWVALDDGRVALVDGLRSAVVTTVEAGTRPTDIAVGAGAVWVTNSGDGTVTRVRLRPAAREATIHVGRDPSALAVGAGGVWVVNRGDGTLSRIDPRTNRVVATIRIGERPESLVVAGGLVWVSVRSK